MSKLDRRRFLTASLAAGGILAASPALAADNARLFAAAREGLARTASQIAKTDVVGVADFNNPSRNARFHLLDMRGGSVTSLLVAHGRGSDPDHSGWLKRFSNAPGSAATSEGAYLTGDYYEGKHGRSMRLHGLDAGNSNALSRAIVVHGAWYVSPQMIKDHGMLGRSEGCFAFCETDLGQVMTRLGPGRLIVAGRF